MDITWGRTSRKHRIGRAHARFVIANTEATAGFQDDGQPNLTWIGEDDRGVELEITGLVIAADKRRETDTTEDLLIIIHVMPTHYRE